MLLAWRPALPVAREGTHTTQVAPRLHSLSKLDQWVRELSSGLQEAQMVRAIEQV